MGTEDLSRGDAHSNGEDFSREVLTRVADAVNAGALGSDVTATVNLAPDPRERHAARSPFEDTLDEIVALLLKEPLENTPLHRDGIRAELIRLASGDDSVEFIEAEWKDRGCSPEMADAIGTWVIAERSHRDAVAVRAARAAARATMTVTASAEPSRITEPTSQNASETTTATAATDAAPTASETSTATASKEPPASADAPAERTADTTTATARPNAERWSPSIVDPDAGKGPYAGALAMLRALKVALRAAPRKEEDEPAVAYVVIAADPERQRIIFSARDGRRWHMTFVPTSHSVEFKTLAITLDTARKLVRLLDSAVSVYSIGANVRFAADTGSEKLWHIAYGEPEPLLIMLKEYGAAKEPEGWRPPAFSVPDDTARAAIVDFDARAIAQATSWPGGGAIVKRDEVDAFGRRHFSIVDTGGVELLRAVIVPHGQTDGLPEDRQQEIPGTLTPNDASTKGKGKKAKHEPAIPAGPAVSAPADAKWRLERRNADGDGFHTIETGTQEECEAKIAAAREGGAFLRLIRPDGTIEKHIDPSTKGAKHEAKRVGGPGKKTKAAPIVHRGKKPSEKPTAKKGAKRGKGKR